MSIWASFSHKTGIFLCFGGLEEINYLQWDPEFVAEAEKTRMIL